MAGPKQRVEQQPAPADLIKLRQGDAEAIEDDAQTQQAGAGKIDARRHMPQQGRCGRIAENHANDDGQRQRAQA